MAYTADQLAAIEKAIATGELEVEFTGPGGMQRIKYRSVEELIKARDQIRAELADAGQIAVPPRVSFASYTKD